MHEIPPIPAILRLPGPNADATRCEPHLSNRILVYATPASRVAWAGSLLSRSAARVFGCVQLDR